MSRRSELMIRILAAAGGPYVLATKLGLRGPTVSGWHQVPAEHVLNVEMITGISRYEIRPDVFGDEGALSSKNS